MRQRVNFRRLVVILCCYSCICFAAALVVPPRTYRYDCSSPTLLSSYGTLSTTHPTFEPHGNRRELVRLFERSESRDKRRFGTAMAFLTGWADIALFTKYRAFVTMMTGNTIWMAMAAVERRYKDVGFYAAVIMSYLLGLVVFRRSDLALKEKSLRLCALVVMLLFVASDALHHTSTTWFPMMLLAIAFGVVNSVGSEVAGTLTFVVTGHMTRLTNQAVDRVSRTAGRKKLTEADKEVALENMGMVGGFFSGAFFASILLARNLLHRWGIVSLLGILYGTLFLSQDMEFLGGAWWLRKDGAMCDVDDDGGVCDLDEEEMLSSSATVAGD